MTIPFIQPDWPAPANVKSIITCAQSDDTPYGTANLGLHVGDQPERVLKNRQQLASQTGVPHWQWLNQVHGVDVIEATEKTMAEKSALGPKADACFTQQKNLACAVLTADCLPVLFCDADGEYVAAAHAGWRGLAAGMLSKAVAQLSKQKPGATWLAYLGPAIGPQSFEVGPEVRNAFFKALPPLGAGLESAFSASAHLDHYYADIYRLASLQLTREGVVVYGGGYCTYSNTSFYSYRRAQITGRFASVIWINR